MSDIDKKEKEDPATAWAIKKLQICSALSFASVCIVIGLPLWWKTTEVYRVNLPYNLISELDSAEISINIEFEVILMKDIYDNYLETFNTSLHEVFKLDESGDVVDVNYKFKIREPDEKEGQALHKYTPNIRELDEHLNEIKSSKNINRPGFYSFYILTDLLAHNYGLLSGVLGNYRNVFIRPSVPTDFKDSCKTIYDTLNNIIIRNAEMNQVYISTKETEQMQLDKNSMRSLRSSLGYDVILTLMNPQPDIVNVQWDVEGAVEKYFQPLLNALLPTELSIRSQYIHLVNINVQAKFDQSCNCYTLPWNRLPHIINPIEPYLASHITNNPALNFVVYVPTREQTPLKIFDQSGMPSKTNSFLVPRWGGLLIKNIETPPLHKNKTLEFPFESELNTKEIFSIILPQLKSLLGFKRPDQNVLKDVLEVMPANRKILSSWEMDVWWLEHAIENIGKSSATLNSLSQLLFHISNIVINDDVGNQVELAVRSMEKSLDLLRSGALKEGYLTSRQALQSSEKAFFDPSLLELLYFPEDQKFAIYIPLFLPVGIPIINTVFQAIKFIFQRKTSEIKF